MKTMRRYCRSCGIETLHVKEYDWGDAFSRAYCTIFTLGLVGMTVYEYHWKCDVCGTCKEDK